jgi:hypothetical protein
MTDKERVTVMVCTSAAGSKCPLAVIGKAKLPVCLRADKHMTGLNIAYHGQENAWFDRVVFEWWAVEVFLPFIQSKFGTEQKVALILDNFKGHQEVQLPKPIITVFLPPNVTSLHLPADQGIICALKRGYKTALLADMVGAVDSNVAYELSQTRAKKRVNGEQRHQGRLEAPHTGLL